MTEDISTDRVHVAPVLLANLWLESSLHWLHFEWKLGCALQCQAPLLGRI